MCSVCARAYLGRCMCAYVYRTVAHRSVVTLFGGVGILNSGKRVAMLATVKGWMRTYRRSHTTGLAELVNLVLESCGLPPDSVAVDEVDEVDITQLLADLGDESILTVGVDYPVLKRARFRTALLEFFDKLVTHCKEDVLFDEYLVESLVEWLISLSSCNARHFRHTATLISLQLVSSQISVATDLASKLEISHEQVETLQHTKKKVRCILYVRDFLVVSFSSFAVRPVSLYRCVHVALVLMASLLGIPCSSSPFSRVCFRIYPPPPILLSLSL
jgi:hypothetical protein